MFPEPDGVRGEVGIGLKPRMFFSILDPVICEEFWRKRDLGQPDNQIFQAHTGALLWALW